MNTNAHVSSARSEQWHKPVCVPLKKHAPQLLGEMADSDLGQGKYKLSLEKQDVLLCHKVRKCSKNHEGMSKQYNLKGLHWPKPRFVNQNNDMNE